MTDAGETKSMKMTDTTTETGNKAAEFTIAHREAMAERLGELLADTCRNIGENNGHVQSGRFGERSKLSELNDDEIRGYIAGQREVLSTMHDWIEHQFAGASDCEETHALTIHHRCAYEMIARDLDGAEGENFRRRHPERTFFPGRFRKLNAWLNTLRDLRIALNDLRYDAPHEEAFEALDRWGRESHEIAGWLIDLRYKCKSREESEAHGRCERERESLGQLLYRDMLRRQARRREQAEAESRRRAEVFRAERLGCKPPATWNESRDLDDLEQIERSDPLTQTETAAFSRRKFQMMSAAKIEGALAPVGLALHCARWIREPANRAAAREAALAQLRGERKVAA